MGEAAPSKLAPLAAFFQGLTLAKQMLYHLSHSKPSLLVAFDYGFICSQETKT
jgi:hypothetical protein